MSHSQILQQAEAFVKELYRIRVPLWRTYHNFRHTQEVVNQCQRMASFYSLGEFDSFSLLAAAWFHDTGFSKGNNDHELKSVEIAFAFLTPFHPGHDVLNAIDGLIMTTRLPSHPTTFCQQILCDADLHHLGLSNYDEWSSLLRSEIEHQSGSTYTEEEWRKENIEFFSSHHFFTEYGRTNWNSGKESNLFLLKEGAATHSPGEPGAYFSG